MARSEPRQLSTPLEAQSRRPARLWLWFLVGFLVVFVGMLQYVKIYDMLPSGRGLARINLWQYYAQRLPHLFAAQPLRPGGTSSSGVFRTITDHVICAGMGGLVAGMIGWKVNRRRLQRTSRG
ncbi:MAG TPA: hypothetical protein VGM98_18820 [Schlesneria sp.]